MFETEKTVLVVDGEDHNRKELKAILETAGYKVDTAENGQNALNKAQTNRFDVALIDIRLPDIEGTELCLKLTNSEEMVKIIITSSSTPEDGAKAADCGADDFLIKTVQPQELLDTIKSRLQKL
jgi:DNA-binding response OmpR family regulator